MEEKNTRGRFEKPQINVCIDRLKELTDNKKKCAVIKLYLENFKAYNDSFGYDFGGMLINEVTSFLDSIDGIESYHIRGVEYILITKAHSQRDVDEVLNTILQRFDNTWNVKNLVCTCSVNAGVVHLPGYANTPDDIFEQLSHAINESVMLGQNEFAEYNEKLRKKIERRSIIAQQIPKAIKDGTLMVRFWPIYQVSRKRFTRIDCSIRMHCEGIGVISEEELIPVAEQSGQIYAISQYAITKVCELVSELIAKNKDFETVAVKISPIQFLQERFAGDVADIIKKTEVPANRLAFEVSENTVHNMFSRAHSCMGELSGMGIEMILAGFGTGSLGVNSILSMSIDVVKIIRMLVWQIDNSSNGSALVDGLIYLCKNFGLKLVAEGVESEAQLKMLEESGCEYLKGLYYSGSLSAEELLPLLSEL